MLKKIKTFFKWIADHTGISWIAKKVSSGWNWLFSSKANTAQENISPKRPSDENVNKSPAVSTPMQNETEEPVSKTGTNVEPAENFPEKSNDEPKGVGYIELDEDNHLWLVLEKGIKVQDYQGSQNEVEPLFNLLIYLRCDKEEYCITGVGNFIHNCYGISVKSIIKKNRDGNYIDNDKILVQDNIEHMKKMLGLKDDVTEIKVDSISNQPFEGTALEQHNLNPTTSQQTVNNKEVTTESEEFYDAAEELDDDFHDAEEVETKTLSIVPIKKFQDNSIVINGVIIPEGAKLKFFPELSNFLSRASSEREKLFCKVVPSSLFIQPKTAEQIAVNDRSC